MIAIGVDIGGSHILSAAVDMIEDKILEDSRINLEVDNKGTQDEIISTWAEAVNYSIGKIDLKKLVGVGFAMPGPFNYRTGMALFKGGNDKYEHLYGVNVAEELSVKLNKSRIAIRFLNDATSFAVGDAFYGKAKGVKKSISITLGTGLGSAFLENGIPIVHRDDVPKDGCLWHIPFRDGIADDYFSSRWFIREYKRITGLEAAGVKEIAEQAMVNEEVKNIFSRFGKNLGELLVPWLIKFPAGIIVMGGNISKAFNLYAESFKKVFNTHNIRSQLAVSDLMEDAALLGSAHLFDESFWSRIKNDLPTN